MNKVTLLERRCWSNEQYSRRECLEISGIPESTDQSNLEEKVVKLFKKIDVTVKSNNFEACHWLKPKNDDE